MLGYSQASAINWGAHVREPTTTSSGSFTYDYELTNTTIDAQSTTGSTSHFLYYDHLYLLEQAASGNTIITKINGGNEKQATVFEPATDSPPFVGPQGFGPSVTGGLDIDIFETVFAAAYSSGSSAYERVNNYFSNRYNFGLVPDQP